MIRGICDFADATKNDNARLSAMEGAVRVFEQALLSGLLQSRHAAREQPTHELKVTLTSEIKQGVANNYVSVSASPIIDVFNYRRSILDLMTKKFPNISELRIFCIQLNIEWDNLRGDTKAEKAASLLDLVTKTEIMRIDEFETIIRNWSL